MAVARNNIIVGFFNEVIITYNEDLIQLNMHPLSIKNKNILNMKPVNPKKGEFALVVKDNGIILISINENGIVTEGKKFL